MADNESYNEEISEEEVGRPGKVKEKILECPRDEKGGIIKVHSYVIPDSEFPPLIITHDIGENITYYKELVTLLNDAGYSVYGFDMRGHENANRKLGHVPSFGCLIKDLLQVVALVKFKSSSMKPVIISRGLGGLVSLAMLKSHKRFVDGVVFVSPMFMLTQTISSFRRFLIKTFADIAPNSMLPRWLTPVFTNAHQETAAVNISKTQPRLQSLLVNELLLAIGSSKRWLRRIDLDCLLVCPEDDPALRYEYLKKFVKKHKNSGRFTLRYVTGEDNLPLGFGDDTLVYLNGVLLEWLNQKYIATKPEKEQTKEPPKEPVVVVEDAKTSQA